MCHDIHYIDSQPFKVTKATDSCFCDRIIHVDHIVISYTYFILYDKFDKTLPPIVIIWSIYVKHANGSLYNCYNVTHYKCCETLTPQQGNDHTTIQ